MNRWPTFSHRLVGVASVAAIALVIGILGVTTSVSDVQSQSVSCADATLVGQAESGGTLAFVDAGAGDTSEFVCISSTEFPGGEGGPFLSDGLVAGCFVIDGLGTSVVAVFREDPAVAPGCDPLISIQVGMQVVGAATPTPTVPAGNTPVPTVTPVVPTVTPVVPTVTPVVPTATPAMPTVTPTTPVRTATPVSPAVTPAMPTATPTRVRVDPTRTVPAGNTPVPTATPVTSAATPAMPAVTPTRVSVTPPSTGSGSSGGTGGNTPAIAGLAILIAAGTVLLIASRRNERNQA